MWALSLAMLHIALISSSMTGNMAEFIASLSINPWARLLMSSDVQAKWKNSSTCNEKENGQLVLELPNEIYKNGWFHRKKQVISVSEGTIKVSPNLSYLRMRLAFLFQEVFHCFYIMICHFFNILNFQGIIHAKAINQSLQIWLSFFAETWNLYDFRNLWKL